MKNNREFRVSWVVDIVAKNPVEAAVEALRIQRDPTSIGVVFEVTDSKTGSVTLVDLLDKPPSEVALGRMTQGTDED